MNSDAHHWSKIIKSLTPIASIFYMHLCSMGKVLDIVSEIFWVRAADSILVASAPILTPKRFTFSTSFLLRITVSAKIFALSRFPLFRAYNFHSNYRLSPAYLTILHLISSSSQPSLAALASVTASPSTWQSSSARWRHPSDPASSACCPLKSKIIFYNLLL